MRKPGTDLMATGVILGSTALAVVATLAFARANSGEAQDATVECTPLQARWAVTYAVAVDGTDASGESAPVRWRWHTRVPAPRVSHEALHRCRHLTVVTTEEAEAVRQRIVETKLIADRLEVVKEHLRTLPRSR